MHIDVDRRQEERDPGSQERLRNELPVKEGVPEPAGRFPVAEKAAAVEHKRGDSGDQNQRDPGGGGVDPPHRGVGRFRKPVPEVVETERCHQFQNEEDPFNRPSEDEDADKLFGRQGGSQADRPPDPHAGDRAEDDGQKDNELGVRLPVFPVFRITRFERESVLPRQQKPAADRVLGNQYVHDRDDGDNHRRSQRRDVPPRIGHCSNSSNHNGAVDLSCVSRRKGMQKPLGRHRRRRRNLSDSERRDPPPLYKRTECPVNPRRAKKREELPDLSGAEGVRLKVDLLVAVARRSVKENTVVLFLPDR